MIARDDGGPAFASINFSEHTDDRTVRHDGPPGMALRDWFAGQALAGLIASREWHIGTVGGSAAEQISAHAYGLADAMLAARKEPTS